MQAIRAAVHIESETGATRDTGILLLCLHGQPTGTIRTEAAEHGVELGRISIAKDRQNTRYGRRVVEETVRRLAGRVQSPECVSPDSIVTASGFGLELGFHCVGEEFDEAAAAQRAGRRQQRR